MANSTVISLSLPLSLHHRYRYFIHSTYNGIIIFSFKIRFFMNENAIFATTVSDTVVLLHVIIITISITVVVTVATAAAAIVITTTGEEGLVLFHSHISSPVSQFMRNMRFQRTMFLLFRGYILNIKTLTY